MSATIHHYSLLQTVLKSVEEDNTGKHQMAAFVNANVYSMWKCAIPALHTEIRNHVASMELAVHMLALKIPHSLGSVALSRLGCTLHLYMLYC